MADLSCKRDTHSREDLPSSRHLLLFLHGDCEGCDLMIDTQRCRTSVRPKILEVAKDWGALGSQEKTWQRPHSLSSHYLSSHPLILPISPVIESDRTSTYINNPSKLTHLNFVVARLLFEDEKVIYSNGIHSCYRIRTFTTIALANSYRRESTSLCSVSVSID